MKQLGNEVLIWRQLRHPNIHQFLGVTNELFEPSYCIVSPWMANGDVMSYSRTKDAGLVVKVALMSEISQGLRYLHEQYPPIVHSDIKGINVLISDDGHCRITDFGLSTIENDLPEGRVRQTTSQAAVRGSVPWFAPELMNPDNVESPNRTSRDIYALGCTIYELLTGSTPFCEKKMDFQIIMAVLNGCRPMRPENCPDLLWKIIEGCWAEDTVSRPSASEVKDQLGKMDVSVLCVHCASLKLPCDFGTDASSCESQRRSRGSMRLGEEIPTSESRRSKAPVSRDEHVSLGVAFATNREVEDDERGVTSVNFLDVEEVSNSSPPNHAPTPDKRPIPNQEPIPIKRNQDSSRSLLLQSLHSVTRFKNSPAPWQAAGLGSATNRQSEGKVKASIEEKPNMLRRLGSQVNFRKGRVSVAPSRPPLPPLAVDTDEPEKTLPSPRSRCTTPDGSLVRKSLVISVEGKPFTRLRLGNCIGRGQLGAVYRALDLNTGQMVAVKRIRLNGLTEEEVTRLMKEVELVKRMSHPSIVNYEGMARDADTLSIVLEYAENGSLGQILQAFGQLNERLVASYVVQILEGLHYLHTNDVIHYDLKAANILTMKNGNVKVSDFGVSLNMRSLEREIEDVTSTPNWMAPEVIELKGASPKSDIWSLACTIIELLAGRPPYGEIPNSMSVMSRIVEDDCPPIPSSFSPLLEDFLKQCFNKDPDKRPSADLLCEHQWLKQNRGAPEVLVRRLRLIIMDY
ncbi:Protein kinase of the Mitotic Exit Network [Marasmius crinis-equi]|uniref:Protein kinase of the Mitotic Exit Network n=1 Tax=Marasmius crinis-equi TaxID=585013 RepID=A0ABR3F511_9AGAR